jgi:lauroyl/myristoyl acyltransferase
VAGGGSTSKPPRLRYSFGSEIPLGAGSAIFFSRREVHPRRKRLVNAGDLKEILLLGFYLCVAAAVPVRYWDRICRFVSRIRFRRHRRKLFARLERDLAAVAPATDPEKFFRDYIASLHRRRLFYMAHVAGWHWKPRILVEGAEEIGRALASRRGALVWCESLAAQTLIGKRALHESGIRAWQVAAREHGLSTTLFGLRVINPILLAIENRFLAGRLAFGATETVSVTRRMLESLGANAVVLVAANTYYGHRFVQVPIGERGYAHFSTVPANIAVQRKAALLGMSAVETVPFAEYRIVIVPIETPRDIVPGKRDRAIAEMVAAFRDRLTPVVANYPEQCLGMGRDLVASPIEEGPGFRTAAPA